MMIPSVRALIDMANNSIEEDQGGLAYIGGGGYRVPIPPTEIVELGDFRRMELTRRSREKRDVMLVEMNQAGAKAMASANHIEVDEERPFGLPRGVNCIDVWEKIFDHVHDVEDIWSLRASCHLFKDLLEMKYTTLRMIEVMLKFGARFGGLLTFLCLRGVCKATKMAIDDWIKKGREDPLYLSYVSFGFGGRCGWVPKPKLRLPTFQYPSSDEPVGEIGLGTLKTILSGLERGTLSRDTLPISEIRLDEQAMGMPNSQIDYVTLRNLFERLLELIGSRVTYFKYCTQDDDIGTYNRLLAWIAFMPNLEELSIYVLAEGDPVEYANRPALPLPLPPFPSCPKLKRFSNEGLGLRAPFVKEIFLANPWISWVWQCPELDGLEGMMQQEVAILQETLGTMRLEGFCWDGWFTYPPQQFLQTRFEWPLKKLTLEIMNRDAGWRPGLNSRLVFGFINTFSKTLEELSVTWKLRDNGGYLDLPKVKKLAWTLWPEIRTLEFLMPLESLKELNVDVMPLQELNRSLRSVEAVKIFFNDMNLPSLFPALRQVRSTAGFISSKWFVVWKS